MLMASKEAMGYMRFGVIGKYGWNKKEAKA